VNCWDLQLSIYQLYLFSFIFYVSDGGFIWQFVTPRVCSDAEGWDKGSTCTHHRWFGIASSAWNGDRVAYHSSTIHASWDWDGAEAVGGGEGLNFSVILVLKFILVLVFVSFFHQSFLFLYYMSIVLDSYFRFYKFSFQSFFFCIMFSFDVVSLACVFHTSQL